MIVNILSPLIPCRRRWRPRWAWPWLVPIGVVLWALIGMALVWWLS